MRLVFLVEVIGDVVFGVFFGWIFEDGGGVIEFYEVVWFIGCFEGEEIGFVRDMSCLLYVVGNDNDGEVFF